MTNIVAQIAELTAKRTEVMNMRIETDRKRAWIDALDLELDALYQQHRMELHGTHKGKTLKKGQKLGGPQFKY